MELLEYFKKDYDIIGFWCNPNIQPIDEYEKRKDSFVHLSKDMSFEYLEADPEKFAEWIYAVHKTLKEGNDRCTACYTVRLQEAFQKMNELGIEYFTTTLTASPYQKHDMIRSIGGEVGREQFLYKDFRPLYYKGKNNAKNKGYYQQKYCGCLMSFEERKIAKKQKNKSITAQ